MYNNVFLTKRRNNVFINKQKFNPARCLLVFFTIVLLIRRSLSSSITHTLSALSPLVIEMHFLPRVLSECVQLLLAV